MTSATSDIEDYSAYLASVTNSEASVFHQFRLEYDEASSATYLFFEGEDDGKYYLPYVRSISSNDNLSQFNCRGKKGLICVKELISKSYSLEKCLFFLDRDHDDLFGVQATIDEHIYLTDFYSVENYLADIKAVEIILSDLCGMNQKEHRYKETRRLYLENRDTFCHAIAPFIIWSLSMRKKGFSCRFCDVNLNNVFELDPTGSVRKKANAFTYYKKVSNIPAEEKIDRIEYQEFSKVLKQIDYRLWLRGKFEIWYLQEALLKLLDNLTDKQRVKIPVTLRHKKLFEMLGGRIQPPSSLTVFLNKKYSAR